MIDKIIIEEEDGKITAIRAAEGNESQVKKSPLIAQARKQLEEYFSGKRQQFDLPYRLNATEFQSEVYRQTALIPYGKTKTYKEIAKAAGNERAARAVGQALNRNKLLFLIPCHRVVGQKNSLTGFALGLELKQRLLNLEKA